MPLLNRGPAGTLIELCDLPGAVEHDDSVRDYLDKDLRTTPLDPDDHRRMNRVARLMGDRHGLVLSGQLPQR
jgi:hypothetical protein